MYKTLSLFFIFISIISAKTDFEKIIPGFNNLSLENQITELLNINFAENNLHDTQILDIYREAANLAEESGNDEYVIRAFQKLAHYEFSTRRYSFAMLRYGRLLNLLDEDQKLEIGNTELKIGECLKFMGLYEKAVEHFIEAMNIAETNNLESLKSSVLVNLGHVNMILGNYDRSLSNYFEALQLKESLNDVNNKAHVLKNLGNVYVRLQDYEEAYDHYYQALEIFEELDDSSGISAVLNNLGNAQEAQKNYAKALRYYEKSKSVASGSKDDFLLQYNFYNIAHMYYKMGRYKESENLVVGNLLLSDNNNNLEIYLKNKLLLGKLAAAQNKIKDAIKLYEEYITQKDSLINIETSAKIASMMVAYDSVELQQNVRDLEKETKTLSRNLWIVILLSVFIIGLMLTSKYIRRPGS